MELRDYNYTSNFIQDQNEPDTFFLKESLLIEQHGKEMSIHYI